MKYLVPILNSILALILTIGCRQPVDDLAVLSGRIDGGHHLVATPYNSGFSQAHDSYNGISVASDGKIYYVLSTQSLEVAGQMFSFDPETEKIQHLCDLTEACGEKGMKAVAQGKSHVNFKEYDGDLYFATHVGYYETVDGVVGIGTPPAGFKPYQGGHIISYNLASGNFIDLGKEPHGEGFLTMNMDTNRGVIYALTWPTGYFIRYDLSRKEMEDLGPVSGKGQSGKGTEFRTLCRAIAIDPESGTAYLTTSEGTILQCRYGEDIVQPVDGIDLKKDYFGYYDVSQSGHMGYNWRQVVWYPPEKVFYCVHGNSGYLFRFDPHKPSVEIVERITSELSKHSGMYDQFSFGYLGFDLGPDGRTLYYLTGSPIYINGKRLAGKATTNTGEAKGLENLDLVTFDIPEKKYRDIGLVFYPDGQLPLYVNAIAVSRNGDVYSLARIKENGKTRTDLIRIRNPMKALIDSHDIVNQIE